MMKENVLDVLMYLFDNCIDDEIDGDGDRGALEELLIGAGFAPVEVDRAFAWLDGLAAQGEGSPPPVATTAPAVRLYAAPEIERLGVRCRGFLLFLEQCGILGPEMRELVIDRVMDLEPEEISLDQLKWVVLMVLFNQPGQEDACAHVEDIVLEGPRDSLH